MINEQIVLVKRLSTEQHCAVPRSGFYILSGINETSCAYELQELHTDTVFYVPCSDTILMFNPRFAALKVKDEYDRMLSLLENPAAGHGYSYWAEVVAIEYARKDTEDFKKMMREIFDREFDEAPQ